MYDMDAHLWALSGTRGDSQRQHVLIATPTSLRFLFIGYAFNGQYRDTKSQLMKSPRSK